LIIGIAQLWHTGACDVAIVFSSSVGVVADGQRTMQRPYYRAERMF
jgi:hypothetical protein